MNDDSTPPGGAVTPAPRRGVADRLGFDVTPGRAANDDPLDDVLNQVVAQAVPLLNPDGIVRTYFIGVRPPVDGARCVDPHPGTAPHAAGSHDWRPRPRMRRRIRDDDPLAPGCY